MDSMRHLSTSLPSTRRRNDAPELLADFKAAALSVTNLYKTAAASQSKARDAGYQDALDDLLAFLDRENLGLMDGEGWRVRQWATERLDNAQVPEQQRRQTSDDETEEEVQGRRHQRADSRSSSPEMQRKAPAVPNTSSEADDTTTLETRRTTASEPPQAQAQAQVPSTDAFTFRSTHAYPTNHDRQEPSGMDLDTAASTPTTSVESTPANIRVVPRRNRNHNRRHNNSSNNAGSAAATLNFNLGAGAGSKRKLPYPEYFDISGFTSDRGSQDGKDAGGGRGGKKGRHV